MVAKYSLLIIALWIPAAFAQTPQGFHGTEDVRFAPELMVHLYWDAVPGATSYHTYKASNPGLTADKCPALTLDDTVTGTSYVDDVSPKWYELSILTGAWKARVWCYAVTAIVNGVESAPTKPVSVTIGNAGYVFWSLRGKGTYSPTDPCAGGPSLPLPSTNLADYKIQVYYQAAGSTVSHYFQTLNIFESNQLAIIWHAPAVATDGFVIPWDDSGSYVVIIRPPGSRAVEGRWNPRGVGITRAYYTQVSTWSLVDPGQPDNGYQCADSYFSRYDLWEDVTK